MPKKKESSPVVSSIASPLSLKSPGLLASQPAISIMEVNNEGKDEKKES